MIVLPITSIQRLLNRSECLVGYDVIRAEIVDERPYFADACSFQTTSVEKGILKYAHKNTNVGPISQGHTRKKHEFEFFGRSLSILRIIFYSGLCQILIRKRMLMNAVVVVAVSYCMFRLMGLYPLFSIVNQHEFASTIKYMSKRYKKMI
ncbi:hypothetical protein BDA99DRAFT_537736 [Phascolomyces articulosus]|uniref:Uncharacterized protein n=1 Tax=Phascolomyces articulosus TaxID=60185 RepID=A0AAD5KAA4_9FUNG|nr:hypothetical protein BDA99DRAFT_537736 [Phascolomyces articulosus]